MTRPDLIQDIHEGYLAAGADLVETNTFGATTIAQADYDMAHLAREMDLASAQIARAAYLEQVEALVEGGAVCGG